jgi:serine phosphatase RsbU (regulator of sigma subunit)
MKGLLLLIFTSLHFLLSAQEQVLLLNKLKRTTSDTQKINTLNALTKLYIDRNLDSAILFNKQSLTLASLKPNQAFKYKGLYCQAYIKRKQKQYDEALLIAQTALETALKTKNTGDEANALVLIGTIYDQSNRNDMALDYFLKALELSKSTGNKKEMLSAYLSLGIYYKKMTKTTAALTNLLEAMKIAEAIPDSGSMFTTCINLGSLYEKANDNVKAKEFYRKALIINRSEKDENDQAIVYYKLGKLFHKLNLIDSAKYYLIATLNIHMKRNDELGLIFDYSNLGGFNMEDGDYSLAKKNYGKALDLALRHNDTIKINMIYSYFGTLYTRLKDYPNALKSFKTSLIYINSMVPKETIMQQYKKISDINNELGNYKEAYLNHVSYKAWSDSSYNVIDTKKQTELKLNYEFEQTQKKIEAETKAKELISKAELESERKQRNYLLTGLAVISLMLVVTVKSYRAKQKANHILQKQKKEIERQKKLVEEKNLEINDSIHYAQRIQAASIPTISELDTYFKNYAMFYKPKDVVSGDFYWAAKMEHYSLIAIADCTGHGVPGAITSMIGSMLLNEIFYVKKLFMPNEVLTELNRLVKLTLRQDNDTLSNDGMDIAFCLVNNSTNELYYAGANRPLYIVNADGLTQYKASKVSVGGQVPLIQDYELHKIQLQPGDTVIVSTDGYADQFGGDREKKFTSKAFRSLLEANYNATPAEQKHIIENTYNAWKKEYEQTDDILVFFLKV